MNEVALIYGIISCMCFAYGYYIKTRVYKFDDMTGWFLAIGSSIIWPLGFAALVSWHLDILRINKKYETKGEE